MFNINLTYVFIILIVFVTSLESMSQIRIVGINRRESPVFQSYQSAKVVLEKSIKAHGGLEKIMAVENVSLEYDGLRTMIN